MIVYSRWCRWHSTHCYGRWKWCVEMQYSAGKFGWCSGIYWCILVHSAIFRWAVYPFFFLVCELEVRWCPLLFWALWSVPLLRCSFPSLLFLLMFCLHCMFVCMACGALFGLLDVRCSTTARYPLLHCSICFWNSLFWTTIYSGGVHWNLMLLYCALELFWNSGAGTFILFHFVLVVILLLLFIILDAGVLLMEYILFCIVLFVDDDGRWCCSSAVVGIALEVAFSEWAGLEISGWFEGSYAIIYDLHWCSDIIPILYSAILSN